MANSRYLKYSKEQLISKIEKLEKQRYGLVWEDKPEKNAERCEKELPILEELKSKEVFSNETLPTNLIIEGDNYHSLFTLNFTHKKSVDIIYIDPPYNTGKLDKAGRTDFKYNDRFIKKEDRFRHSSWLSFMNKRLRLAKNLLKETGVIAISIDDNEVFNLKLLCDKVFGESNHIATVPTIMNLKGNQDQFGFAGTHEYTLFYARYKSKATIGEFDLDEEDVDSWSEDSVGLFKQGRGLLADSKAKYREERGPMYFPVLIKKDKVYLISKKEYEKIYNKKTKTFDDDHVETLRKKYQEKGFEFVLPIDSKKNLLRWTWGYDGKFQTHRNDIIINRTKNGITLYKKQRPKLGDLPSIKPKSVLYRPEYSSGNGTNQLSEILGEDSFNNPKPKDLIKDILFISGPKDALILDFFAGSGTTGQAALELNKEDGGARQFVLCTNDENDICQKVTYPRIKKVIQGYKKYKGIKANLKYFKADFVPTILTDNDKRVLAAKSTQLLCVAENTFELVEEEDNDFQIYQNSTGYMAVIYEETTIAECCEALNRLPVKSTTSIYVFSYDHTYDDQDFESLKIPFSVKPIPEVILNVYRKISKLKNK